MRKQIRSVNLKEKRNIQIIFFLIRHMLFKKKKKKKKKIGEIHHGEMLHSCVLAFGFSPSSQGHSKDIELCHALPYRNDIFPSGQHY